MNMKTLLALGAVAIVTVAAYAADYPEITIKDLKTAMAEQKVTLLDANGTESYQKGHIPGAVDYTAVETKLAKVLPKDKNALVVAYCGGPKCGAYQSAAKAAQKLGYTNVKHLTAGISGWKEAGETMAN
jgi:rhodanese-related sulfurtransferase